MCGQILETSLIPCNQDTFISILWSKKLTFMEIKQFSKVTLLLNKLEFELCLPETEGPYLFSHVTVSLTENHQFSPRTFVKTAASGLCQ